MLLLCLESSTSSAKAMVYSTNDGPLEVEAIPYPLDYNRNGEHDTEKIFNLTIDLGNKLAKKYNIDAITLSSTWHSLVVCDSNNNPVMPALSWDYLGAAGLAKSKRNSNFQKEYHSKTGCLVHGMYPCFKLLNLKNNGYCLADKRFFSQGSYNYFKLTGKHLTSKSMASGSGLMDIHSQKYDSRLLNNIEISETQLEALAQPMDIHSITTQARKLLAVPPNTPVLIANPDGALNQVGAKANTNGLMPLSVGTSGAMRLASSKVDTTNNNWCYLTPYSYLVGAATSGACNCVDWFKSKFLANISYSQIEHMHKTRITDYSNLPFFLPFMFGERAPGWNENRSGGFLGVKAPHDVYHLYLSLLEGVLFNLKQCYDNLKTVSDILDINMSGGILSSPLWSQMAADILDSPLTISENSQLSLIGSAFSFFSQDKIKSLPPLQHNEKIISPSKNKEIFANRYHKYLELYNNSLTES